MPDRQRAAQRVQLVHGYVSHLLRSAKILLRKLVRPQGREVAKHLPSEGLVELKDVNVAHRHAELGENLVRAVGRPKKEIFEGIHRHERPAAQVRLGLESQLEGLLLAHDQSRRRPIGQKGGVRRRVRPVRLDEGWSQAGKLLQRAVALDAVFFATACDRDNLIGVQAVGVGRRGILVGAQGELVLILPAHAKPLGQAVTRVAHDLAGGEVRNRRGFGSEMRQGEAFEHVRDGRPRPFLHDFLAPQQLLPKRLGEADGKIREGLHAAGHDHIRLATQDLLRALADRRVRTDASLCHRVRRHALGDAGAHGGLSRDVGRPGLLDHRAIQNVVDQGRVQRGLRQQAL
mmetsp:Transcript_12909/g.47804  ORF Transcript_12909/g.47804 Transcript_12909/m.47804 type:complete len:345 (+) Transcript_12909:1783-2817(+)